MGTRHLIAAVIDGDFKLAQYGQWDGYPDGQGVGVLKFLREADLDAFKTKLRQCHWITKDESAKVEDTKDWPKAYPHLSRDAGSDVLTYINNSDAGLALADIRGFAGDSLFCEWGYVLDFDNGVLEVYRGFNTDPTAADSRFPSGADWLEHSNGYEPIRLVKRFKFDELPTDDQFTETLNSEDDANIDWGGQMAALISESAA